MEGLKRPETFQVSETWKVWPCLVIVVGQTSQVSKTWKVLMEFDKRGSITEPFQHHISFQARRLI